MAPEISTWLRRLAVVEIACFGSAGKSRTTHPSHNKKHPRNRIPRVLEFSTTYRNNPLGFCCRRCGLFFLVNRCRLTQHDLAYNYPVTDIRVIDRRRHVWPNRRPSHGMPFWIQNGRVFRVVIPNGGRSRRRAKHDIIRIRRVSRNRPCACGRGGCCRASHRIRRRRCGLLRESYAKRCRARHSRCQYFH